MKTVTKRIKRRKRKSAKRGGAVETKEYPDGTYVGNIVDDKREGKGKMTYANGEVYDGEWVDDKRDIGNLTYPNGAVFTGNCGIEKKEGRGRMQYENGDVYNGRWLNDKREGYGFMRYVNGDSYTGDWVNDKRQGHGLMEYFGRRDDFDGEWFNDLPVAPQPRIDGNQIHKFTANIDFTKLNAFLKDHSKNENPYIDQPIPDDFGVYIKGSMDKIIRSTDAAKIEERVKDFKRLMEDTLDQIKYKVFSDNLKTGVFLSLKYTQLQPVAFKEAYVQSYLDDTCKAYGETNSTRNFSCPTGAFERFVTSLAPAATAVLSTGNANDEQKQEYEQLVKMITRNLKTLIPNLIREWQRSHRNGVGLENIVGDEPRRANLKAYVEEAVTNDTSEINALIENFIKDYADSIGYEDAVFQLGGRKTRKRKKKRSKKIKSKKRKIRRR
uniref:Uncharacterized protein n=1 Tax=viral metagenome TaxID=1070528 RepID=A0A6C0LKB1_9ZZZZ